MIFVLYQPDGRHDRPGYFACDYHRNSQSVSSTSIHRCCVIIWNTRTWCMNSSSRNNDIDVDKQPIVIVNCKNNDNGKI